MNPQRRWNAPNTVTVARIAVTPLLAWLILQDGLFERWAAFFLFVAAAVSDVIDGNLARGRGQITRFGQLLDPIADKLLVLTTFVPLYWIGLLPLWLVLLVLGREALITAFRRYADNRGTVIAASGWGKSKAMVQNWFIGSVLVFRINLGYMESGATGPAWAHWHAYTRSVIEVGFWFVVVLTVLSLIDYLYSHRALWIGRSG
ncbi:MAG TPA: CDP-diacylglycerol--glycerol-3-phosphate 3-phosphatidyltransferase [Gemmatimonadota bacterium]|nr:CDP-diacylglycerol--glycerol-3-phosphate 3-phosphatidyltransferase [Gemmatimonadota bacterium]